MRRERPESIQGAVQTRSRWWSVTIFGKVGGEDKPDQPNLELERNGLLYYKFQLELCPTTHRKHFQGCVRYDRPISMKQVKTFLGVDHAHLEVVRDVQHMREYCGKEETRLDGPWEGGDAGHQGKSSDLQEATTLIHQGASLEQVAITHPMSVARYGRGLRDLWLLINPPRVRPHLKVYLLWGPTGTGKTNVAQRIDPNVCAVSDLKNPWLDGYEGGKTLLFDECGSGMMCINRFKMMTDKYKVKGPIKGGFVAINADLIICTSNQHFTDWWPGAKPEDIMAIERRFTRVFHVRTFVHADEAYDTIMKDLNPDPTSPLPQPLTESPCVHHPLAAGRPRRYSGLQRGPLSYTASIAEEQDDIADVLSDSESEVRSVSSQGGAAAMRAAEFLDLTGSE